MNKALVFSRRFMTLTRQAKTSEGFYEDAELGEMKRSRADIEQATRN